MDQLKEWLPILAMVFGGGGVIAVLKYQAGQAKESHGELKTMVKDQHTEVMGRLSAQDVRLGSIELHVERLDERVDTSKDEIQRLRDKVSYVGLPKKGNGQ